MYEVKVKSKNEVDKISDKLEEFGALSISTTSIDNATEIVALFDEVDSLSLEFENYDVRKLTESDWKHNWLDNYEGAEISDEIFIYPHNYSKPKPENYKYIIELDPKDAFGNGDHPTTSMCLRELHSELSTFDEQKIKQISLLDAGTGTGILAILASMMGVRMIDAFDLDQESVDKTLENCKYNDVESIYVMKSDILVFPEVDKYNIITANLLTDIVLKSLDKFVSLLADDGVIIVSGIGESWNEEVSQAFENKKLKIKKHIVEAEWSCYILGHM